jgi:hypothetical protein
VIAIFVGITVLLLLSITNYYLAKAVYVTSVDETLRRSKYHWLSTIVIVLALSVAFFVPSAIVAYGIIKTILIG